jgi:thiol-disulfide isomerase/thioredoxin
VRFLGAILFFFAPQLAPLDEGVYRKILQQQRDRVVLVNFWATWCEPCREEMPHLAALERKLRNRGFALITISADEPEQEAEAFQFLKDQGVRFPAYLKRVENDDRFISSIDAKWSGALPALFLFDRHGSKAASFIGETEMKDLEAAIEKLL